jgi:hypothetical protein
MKIKHYLILLIFGSLLTQISLRGQQTDSQNEFFKDKENSIRKVYVYAGVGLFEIFNLGIGYQVSPELAFSFKYAGTWIGYANFNIPSTGTGVGVKISHFSKLWLFNNISAEYISYLNLTLDRKINSVTKGNYFELNVGNENVDKSKLKIYWAIGLGISDAHTVSTLFFPSLKVGINYNLF